MQIGGGRLFLVAAVLCAQVLLVLPGAAQNYDPSLLSALK